MATFNAGGVTERTDQDERWELTPLGLAAEKIPVSGFQISQLEAMTIGVVLTDGSIRWEGGAP